MGLLVDRQAKLEASCKNFICNFRAPNLEKFLCWNQFVGWAKENGWMCAISR